MSPLMSPWVTARLNASTSIRNTRKTPSAAKINKSVTLWWLGHSMHQENPITRLKLSMQASSNNSWKTENFIAQSSWDYIKYSLLCSHEWNFRCYVGLLTLSIAHTVIHAIMLFVVITLRVLKLKVSQNALICSTLLPHFGF